MAGPLAFVVVLTTLGDGGGESCKSSSEVALPPPPVKVNKLRKNRYHSRDIKPVRGSMKSTRDDGMLVTLNSGICWTQYQFSAHDGNLDRVSARHFVDPVAQLQRHAQPPPKDALVVRPYLTHW